MAKVAGVSGVSARDVGARPCGARASGGERGSTGPGGAGPRNGGDAGHAPPGGSGGGSRGGRRPVAVPPPGKTFGDRTSETPAGAVTAHAAPGVPWQSKVEIGDCTLYLGDCADVLPALPTGSIDLVVMDPPYTFTVASKCAEGKLSPWADIMNSARFFGQVYGAIKNLLPENGAMWTFLNWKTMAAVQKGLFDAGWWLNSVLVWDKLHFGTGGTQGLRPSFELVALACNPGFRIGDRRIRDIVQVPWTGAGKRHPAQKPQELVRWLIQISGATHVLDPFMGSGTTGAACADLGVRFTGVEMDEQWFDVAAKRIAAAKEHRAALGIEEGA